MSEQFTDNSEIQQLPTRELIIGGELYTTDLPAGVEIFSQDAKSATHDPLNMRDLDKLEPGNYSIWFAGEDQEAPYVVARSVIMRQGPKGLVIDRDCYAPPFDEEGKPVNNWPLGKSTSPVMLALGFEIGTDEHGRRVTSVPTPNTLYAAAAEQGVTIEFFEEEEIRTPEYLGANSRGNQPVSYAFYDHDAGDDHITARVLGGEPMTAGLQRISTEALKQNKDVQDSCTLGIDSFTGVFREALSHGLDTDWAGWSAKEWVMSEGLLIGLTEPEIEAMLEVGISNADRLGMVAPNQKVVLKRTIED